MSAPAGWHQQPDGRERFWDGQQWTEQFRSPAGSDPTAPPPPPSWASGDGTAASTSGDASSSATGDAAASDHTQAMDVDRTQQLPTVPPAADPGAPTAAYGGAPSATPAPQGYAPGDPAAAPPSGYGSAGYGTAGDTGWQPPQKSGGSGLLKGCLITVAVLLVILIGVVVAGIFLFNRAADEVRNTIPSGFPTSLPSDFPTTLPSDFPSDLPTTLPTEGVGQTIDITVGQGFDVPRATIEDGWSLDAQGAAGFTAVQVRDMKATLGDGAGVPIFFTLRFPTADGGTADSVCTSPSGESGETVDITCLPMLADVGDATKGTATTTL